MTTHNSNIYFVTIIAVTYQYESIFHLITGVMQFGRKTKRAIVII